MIKRFLTIVFLPLLIMLFSPLRAEHTTEKEHLDTQRSIETPAHTEILDITSTFIVSPAKVSVTLPEGYSTQSEPYPVVYLLNGHGGNHLSWGSFTNLDSLATEYDIIIVCPDGRNSWYWDSPVDSSMQMESYITKELIPFIDSTFNTRKDPDGRAITGLSMGGHGGLWLGIRHPELFKNAGSTSGGVEIIPFPTRWNIADRLGPYKTNKSEWQTHSVKSLVESGNLKPGQLNIIFDCGTEDFFFNVNNSLHTLLNQKEITHTYLTSPGAHTPSYWRKSIIPQLEFFHSQFNRQ